MVIDTPLEMKRRFTDSVCRIVKVRPFEE